MKTFNFLIGTFTMILIIFLISEIVVDVYSIRERIYAGDNQCGILIYTSASDSEGTLGGLSRLAKPERMSRIFKYSYLNASKCSNDPLCSYGTLSDSEEQNGSICHSCLLLPETSCENFNSRLSRMMIENFLHKHNVTHISK